MSHPRGSQEYETILAGFGISGYRSFRESLQLIAPLKKVNLLAGINNSGKSNILRFVRDKLGPRSSRSRNPLDQPNGMAESGDVAIAVDRDSQLFTDFLQRLRDTAGVSNSYLQRFIDSPALRLTGDNLIWIRCPNDTAGAPPTMSVAQAGHFVNEFPEPAALQHISSRIATHSYYDDATRNAQSIFQRLASEVMQPLNIEMIEAVREIRSDTSEEHNLNGLNLIAELRRIQDPEVYDHYDRDVRKFAEITQFVRDLFDDPHAQLRVPHNLSTINISQDGQRPLPLEHYGTGMQQVVILAAAATLTENSLVCIEEPEVNLHPLLQRKLVRYLTRHTTNQYLIATHSASMLDYERAAVFSVRLVDGASNVALARLPHEVAEICGDLGYRASDLLQANAVIWVEGPSDRVYVKHWIKCYAPELREGLHYSIMFYGGRLLSNLSVSDVEIEEFISLRKLNRNVCVLIDRDTTSPRARISPTKDRIRREFQVSGPGFAWLTHGYTIENYIPHDLTNAALQAVHPTKNHKVCANRWVNPFPAELTIDKLKIARYVCRNWPESEFPNDLRGKLNELTSFIRKANDEQSATLTR